MNRGEKRKRKKWKEKKKEKGEKRKKSKTKKCATIFTSAFISLNFFDISKFDHPNVLLFKSLVLQKKRKRKKRKEKQKKRKTREKEIFKQVKKKKT